MRKSRRRYRELRRLAERAASGWEEAAQQRRDESDAFDRFLKTTVMFLAQGRHEEAERYARRTLFIRRKADARATSWQIAENLGWNSAESDATSDDE